MANIDSILNWRYMRCTECGRSVYETASGCCQRTFNERRSNIILKTIRVHEIFGVELSSIRAMINVAGSKLQETFRDTLNMLDRTRSSSLCPDHFNPNVQLLLAALDEFGFEALMRNPAPALRSTMRKSGQARQKEKFWPAIGGEPRKYYYHLDLSKAYGASARCKEAHIKQTVNFQNTEETQMKTTVIVLSATSGLAIQTTNDTARSVLNGLELVNITRNEAGDIIKLQRADVNANKVFVNLSVIDSEAELAVRAQQQKEAKLDELKAKLDKLDEERAEITKLMNEVKKAK